MSKKQDEARDHHPSRSAWNVYTAKPDTARGADCYCAQRKRRSLCGLVRFAPVSPKTNPLVRSQIQTWRWRRQCCTLERVLKLVAPLLIHKHTMRFHSETSLQWVTDSKPAVSIVTKSAKTLPSKIQQGNADYLAMIRESYAKIPFVPSVVWVKGHQTQKCTAISADVDCNNRTDFLAIQYPKSGKSQSSEKEDHVPSSLISISIMGKRLTNHIESCLRFHVNGYHLRQYLQRKLAWYDST
jgi:hypothetical protein